MRVNEGNTYYSGHEFFRRLEMKSLGKLTKCASDMMCIFARFRNQKSKRKERRSLQKLCKQNLSWSNEVRADNNSQQTSIDCFVTMETKIIRAWDRNSDRMGINRKTCALQSCFTASPNKVGSCFRRRQRLNLLKDCFKISARQMFELGLLTCKAINASHFPA